MPPTSVREIEINKATPLQNPPLSGLLFKHTYLNYIIN
jgi:hypothetical protein